MREHARLCELTEDLKAIDEIENENYSVAEMMQDSVFFSLNKYVDWFR